jgi:hypothetical protein
MKVHYPDDHSVLKLFEPVTWWRRVAAIISKTIPESVEAYLRNFPADKMYCDTLSYLEEAYTIQHQQYPENKLAEIGEELCKKFAFVRGYHGCKPFVSLDSYYSDGIQALTRQWLAQITYEVLDGHTPLEELQRLAACAELSTREGHIYFTSQPDVFVKDSGHYLIHGPESLSALWQRPDRTYDQRVHEVCRRYTNRGIPTIFTCYVPIRMLPCDQLKGLSSILITNHFRNRSQIKTSGKLRDDFVFSINENLPANYIHAHHHPAVITDPQNFNLPYYNSQTSCPWCEKSPF